MKIVLFARCKLNPIFLNLFMVYFSIENSEISFHFSGKSLKWAIYLASYSSFVGRVHVPLVRLDLDPFVVHPVQIHLDWRIGWDHVDRSDLDRDHFLVQIGFEKTVDGVVIVAAVYDRQGLDEFRILKENNEIVLIRWPIRNRYF